MKFRPVKAELFHAVGESGRQTDRLMKLEFSRQIFEKYSNVKFQENLSGSSRIVSCGRRERETDGRTDGRKDRQT
jgi:hypothetical protein